jgi:signal transduction histidine kinase
MVREVSRRLRENDQMAIDDLHLKTQELAVAYQKMEEQESARSEFLTIAAHELRTPLMATNGFILVIRM